mmetsp:Transcript_56150/g.93581  ORF Transcript_56150/g.93581 Transcript_56150/m.93581 type:complete len:179 (+) Transcript_56150:47-583(+)|eukprot:CAMPEP_0202713938 /NCGR_PEP_ID=MMETSP1385-20130828/61784_1 /ASSEMBLY_ACC=CAM_ASM_000861 /TAXON_ID=933848 /ORGANISM="Elphidium margaritaceum" /LENGTH=178 /DNA_ID=CAMNT_0049374493 /DNA_START=24 /DNA_END=560 /DNA_ORIENTATION=-
MALELAPQIEAITILDEKGNRLCAKFYSNRREFANVDAQTKFEKAILSKANRSIQRSDTDVLLYNDHLVLYISSSNIRIFVVASASANELVIDEVITALENSLTTLLKGAIDARGIVDNMDYVLLAMDEVCEDGLICECDGDNIASRVLMKDISQIRQETISSAAGVAYKRIRDQWLK